MDYEAYAKEFYGTSYHNAKNPTKLHDACKWLDKAIGFEAQGELGTKKTEMAFSAALKAEAEAFA